MRQPLRHVVDAGVLAVYGAERIVDVQVGKARQVVGERAAFGVVLARLPGVEAQVLEQRDVAILEPVDHVVGVIANRVGGERHRRVQQLAEAGDDRRKGVPRLRRPLGRPRWAQTTTRAPRSRSALNSGDAGADAAVVGDRRAVEGTLRSERTRTRFPRRRPRSSERLHAVRATGR